MGEVQTEILTRKIKDRFGVDVAFGEGRILYKETIAAPVEGVGHFEPLKHYAEVHLLLEPLPRGTGLVTDTVCPTDELASNWQNLVDTVLNETQLRGVLVGAPLTDIKITLLTGRSHPKHTEGGDFREATLRALRQGLMSTRSVLLEPFYAYRLSVPSSSAGRAIHDLQMRHAEFVQETDEEEPSILNSNGRQRFCGLYGACAGCKTFRICKRSCGIQRRKRLVFVRI